MEMPHLMLENASPPDSRERDVERGGRSGQAMPAHARDGSSRKREADEQGRQSSGVWRFCSKLTITESFSEADAPSVLAVFASRFMCGICL